MSQDSVNMIVEEQRMSLYLIIFHVLGLVLGPGPRGVTGAEIYSIFREGWRINYVRQAMFESNIHQGGARAWLSSITRLQNQSRIGFFRLLKK
jgi:hypothetical protein